MKKFTEEAWCDKCGAQVDKIITWTTLTIYSDRTEFDLCRNCNNELLIGFKKGRTPRGRGMSERVSDEELADLLQVSRGIASATASGEVRIKGALLSALIAELQERRRGDVHREERT